MSQTFSLSVPPVFRPLIMALICTWLYAGPGRAGELIGSAQGGISSKPSQFEGVRVDTVAISNRNVFDTAEATYRKFPYSLANWMHVRTRPRIVHQEILLKQGQPFSTELAVETARNLRTRLALYDAWVETEQLPDGRLLVNIVTVDQWSLLVGIRARRDGDRTYYQFGLEDRNLLGLNQSVAFDYFVPQKDTNHFRLTFSDPRIAGLPIALEAIIDTDPQHEEFGLGVSNPYYDLSQSNSWSVLVKKIGGRTDFRHLDTVIAQSHTSGGTFETTMGHRWGSYHNKISLSGDYLYHSTRTSDTSRIGPIMAIPTAIPWPSDSTYHRLQLATGLQRIYFGTARRINGFSYTEDITLGQSLGVSVGRAYPAGFGNHLYDQVEFSLSSALQTGRHFMLLSYERKYWFLENSPTQHASNMAIRYYNTNLPLLTLAARIAYLRDQREGAPLILGGETGLRGYRSFFQTGDRIVLTNIEARFFPGFSILSTLIGAVVFVDGGRAFQPGDNFTLGNMAFSFGVGLRISFERFSKTDVLRLDLSHVRDVDTPTVSGGAWRLSFGTRQYF